MIKKIALICVLSLLLSSAGLVFAGNTATTPESPLYPVIERIEDTFMNLTLDNEATALLALRFADEKINILENEAANGRPAFVDELLERNEALMERARIEISGAPEDQEELGQAVERYEEVDARRISKLTEILGRDDLPEGAAEGIGKAMANQQNAYENFMNAMEKAQEARQNGEENGNGEPNNGAGNKPDSVPPADIEIPVDIPNPGNGNPNQ